MRNLPIPTKQDLQKSLWKTVREHLDLDTKAVLEDNI